MTAASGRLIAAILSPAFRSVVEYEPDRRVVDGERFVLGLEEICGGYERRRMKIPNRWIAQVDIEESKWGSSYSSVYPVN